MAIRSVTTLSSYLSHIYSLLSTKMFQPIIAPKPTNRKLVVPTVASPFTIEENGKENVAASNIHLTYDYTSKDFVHTISQGIKTNKVSDADLLSISLISSAKKRKLYGESTNPIRTSSSSAFSRPSFDFRKGGCLHDTEEEEAEQSHLIDSIVQNATSSMPTSPAQIDVNAADNQEYIDGSGDNYDESYEDMHVENTTDLQPEAPVDQSEETEEASENWAQLRQKVGQAVLYQLLHVINNGSAEQLMELRGIGKKRAQAILDAREEGFEFSSTLDLDRIGMTEKAIITFIEKNVQSFVNLEEI